MDNDIYNYNKHNLTQPDRSLPPLEEEIDEGVEESEEERLYYMSIIKKTCNSNFYQIDEKKDNKTIKKNNIEIPKKVREKKNIEIPKKIIEKRRFNPRLPIPDNYKSSYNKNNFKLNNNNFPTL